MTSDEQAKSISIEQMFDAHKQLFPNRFEFLVLFNLYVNYHSGEIRYAEIKQAIIDTSRLPLLSYNKERQVETAFKSLFRSFIERIPDKPNTFALTLHAVKIVDIAVQRINSPYLAFPLKDTFETYFTLPENVTDDIKNLKSWHKLGFQNNARQIVSDHLEALKLSVDDSIKALNQILEADNLSALQMLEQFSGKFRILGDKASQIAEAINMKVSVHYRLRDIVDSYDTRVPSNPSVKSSDNTDFEVLKEHRQQAVEIRKDVSSFFEKVDQQLALINTKMAFASFKIAELQESLRVQSLYKIKLKKMLAYLLENSKPDPRHWVKLPDKFPAKDLVMQKFRFRALHYYDEGFLKKTKPFEPEKDETYEAIQRQELEAELAKQFVIQERYEAIKSDLRTSDNLNLSRRLLDIISEDGLEVGVHTAYESIRNLADEKLDIEEELQSDNNNKLHVWKVIIQSTPDSNS
jgi:hypothetical protein